MPSGKDPADRKLHLLMSWPILAKSETIGNDLLWPFFPKKEKEERSISMKSFFQAALFFSSEFHRFQVHR